MHPEKLGFEDCDLNSIFKAIDKETQTGGKKTVHSSDGAVKTYKLPLPRELEKREEGTIKVFSFCQIIQDPDCPKSVTIVRESVTEEVHSHSETPNDEAFSNRYRYCKEVIKPYLKDYPPDCPNSSELLLRDAIITANEEFPDYPPCYEIPDSSKESDKKPNGKIKKDEIFIPPKKGDKDKDLPCHKDPKKSDKDQKKPDKDLSGKRSNKDISGKKSNKDISTKKSNKDLSTKKSNKDISTKKSNKDLSTKKSNKDISTKNSDSNLSAKKSNKDLTTKKSNKDLSRKKSDKDLSSKKSDDNQSSPPPVYFDKTDKHHLVLCPGDKEAKICIEVTDPKFCPDICKQEYQRDRRESDGRHTDDDVCSDRRTENEFGSQKRKKRPCGRRPEVKPGSEEWMRECNCRENPPSEKPYKKPCQVLPPRGTQEGCPLERNKYPPEDFYPPELSPPEDDNPCGIEVKNEPPPPKSGKEIVVPIQETKPSKPGKSFWSSFTGSKEDTKKDSPAQPTKKDTPAPPTKKDCPTQPVKKDSPPQPAKKDNPPQPNSKDNPEQPKKTDCLTKLLRTLKIATSEAETCTRDSPTSKNMDGTSEKTKKCIPRPKTPPPTLSGIPVDRCPKESDSSRKLCKRKSSKSDVGKCRAGRDDGSKERSDNDDGGKCRAKKEEGSKGQSGNDDGEKCRARKDEGSKERSGNNDGEKCRFGKDDGVKGSGKDPGKSDDATKGRLLQVYQEHGRGCNCPENPTTDKTQTGKKEACQSNIDKTIKSAMDAHNETLATLKCAMEDFMCKVFRSTQDAVTLITTESAKQLEKFRKSSSTTECPPPKKVSDTRSQDNLRRLSLVNIDTVSNEKKLTPCVPPPEPEGAFKYIDQFVSKVDSAMSMISDTITVGIPKPMRPSNYNDTSSKYDIPISSRPMPPTEIENVLKEGTSSMFTTLKDKIWSMFCEDDNKDKELSACSSTDSSASSDDEDLLNRLID